MQSVSGYGQQRDYKVKLLKQRGCIASLNSLLDPLNYRILTEEEYCSKLAVAPSCLTFHTAYVSCSAQPWSDPFSHLCHPHLAENCAHFPVPYPRHLLQAYAASLLSLACPSMMLLRVGGETPGPLWSCQWAQLRVPPTPFINTSPITLELLMKHGSGIGRGAGRVRGNGHVQL